MSNPALERVVQGSLNQGQNQGPPAGAGGFQNWNMPGGQQTQTGYQQPGYPQQPGYQQPYAPQPQIPAQGYMTMDDVVVKTSITLVTALVVAIGTWVAFAPSEGSTDYSTVLGIAIGGAILGFILGLVNAFKRNPSGPLVLAYAVCEGAFLGGITGVFNVAYPGIAIQAVLATAGVFIGMLIVYRTGAIRVTPKFQRRLTAALIGAVILMLFNLGIQVFTGQPSLFRSGGTVAIIFSLVMIAIASFTLLSDFDLADQAIRRGAPKNFAWGIAFGLTASIVWLYIEILRLLSYLRN